MGHEMTERSAGRRPTILMIGVGRPDLPWWWSQIDHSTLACQIDYRELPFAGGRPPSPFSWRFLKLFARTTGMLWRARRDGYDYVFSFENDWLTFIIAAVQTALWWRAPRHVIVQFIMREQTPALKSRLKYAVMRWCFSSVFLCVCSSRPEIEYYRRTFGWPARKLAFVPFHTDPKFTQRPPVKEEPFVLAAGRTFRDYPTLVAAVTGTDLAVTIVAGRRSFEETTLPPNVTVLFDLPLPELIGLIGRASIVVLPLQPREISTGQSVLLEAMAMGKAVVVTSVAGTVDYLTHMQTGLLVPPHDPVALREALQVLAGDGDLRRRIGEAGRADVLRKYLPDHYFREVCRILRDLA